MAGCASRSHGPSRFFYRRAFNAEPQTCKRWVDGEERDVNFYVKPEAVAMLDDEIHAYFREVGS